MKKRHLIPVATGAALLLLAACSRATEKAAPSSEPAAAAAPAAAEPAAPAATDDATKFAGKWMSDAGQMTQYVFEEGKLYVLLGSEKNEVTLADGGISYRAAGMTVRMKYRFVDDNTLEYTDPSMPNWSLVQKRQ